MSLTLTREEGYPDPRGWGKRHRGKQFTFNQKRNAYSLLSGKKDRDKKAKKNNGVGGKESHVH